MPAILREVEIPAPCADNRLGFEQSAYLRSARHQPVCWRAWGEDALLEAQAKDKPILLDIGAVWCHWCHVMDRESYEDAEIARLVNEHFVPVKVDRDERPEVDARYQAAVSAISGQGGWPLTVFLTPEGHPYYGGTYFPREDRWGRPGFARILQAMASVWRERRNEALTAASGVMAALRASEQRTALKESLTPDLVDQIAEATLGRFDKTHGGFGDAPKFPHPSALDLLLEFGLSRDHAPAVEAFAHTLEQMGRGGVYDQLAGGLHRYSVDEHWRVPHFEKMLCDNTELLRNYAHGYQSLVKPEFLQKANEILAWFEHTMSDREHGGFYASQDADIDLEDDGDYFTWTLAEVRAVLEGAELETARRYWSIREVGDMSHDAARNVLHRGSSLAEIAAELKISEDSAAVYLAAAKEKLLVARRERLAPFIDSTLYTHGNAMAIMASLEAARVLRRDDVRAFALLTLERLLAEAWDGNAALSHVIAYAGAAQPARRAPGTLDDYAFTVHACVDGWLASGKIEFYRAGLRLAEAMLEHFWDAEEGGFFDTAADSAESKLGALSFRRKPFLDAPTRGANPVAASALLRLEALSGRGEFRQMAERTLRLFAPQAAQAGLHAAAYALALERLLLDPIQVMIVGSGPEAVRLEAVAVARFAVNKTVMRIAPHRLVSGELPEALARTLALVPPPAGAEAWALVCRQNHCLPPITDGESLLAALEE